MLAEPVPSGLSFPASILPGTGNRSAGGNTIVYSTTASTAHRCQAPEPTIRLETGEERSAEEEEDAEDVHICGGCKARFWRYPAFLQHKTLCRLRRSKEQKTTAGGGVQRLKVALQSHQTSSPLENFVDCGQRAKQEDPDTGRVAPKFFRANFQLASCEIFNFFSRDARSTAKLLKNGPQGQTDVLKFHSTIKKFEIPHKISARKYRRYFASYSVIALIHFAIFPRNCASQLNDYWYRYLYLKFLRKINGANQILGVIDRGQRSQLEAEAARLLTDKFNKQLPSSLEVMTSQPLTSQPLEDEEEEDERMEIVTVEESSSLTFYMRSSRDSPEPAVQGKNLSYVVGGSSLAL